MSSTEPAAESRCPGSIAIVSGAARSCAQLDVDRQARKALRQPSTRPSHDLADYAGDYDHPGYGRMTITHAGDELRRAYRGMSEPLAHRHYDTFELPEAPDRLLPDRLAISFSTDREGNIATLSAPAWSPSSRTSSSPALPTRRLRVILLSARTASALSATG